MLLSFWLISSRSSLAFATSILNSLCFYHHCAQFTTASRAVCVGWLIPSITVDFDSSLPPLPQLTQPRHHVSMACWVSEVTDLISLVATLADSMQQWSRFFFLFGGGGFTLIPAAISARLPYYTAITSLQTQFKTAASDYIDSRRHLKWMLILVNYGMCYEL